MLQRRYVRRRRMPRRRSLPLTAAADARAVFRACGNHLSRGSASPMPEEVLVRAFVFAIVCSSLSLGCGGKILAGTSTGDGANGDGASGGNAGGGATQTADAADAGTPSANDPFHVGDDWSGKFICEGGPADLDLHIVAMHDDEIDDALFQFDLDGVTGSYHVYGDFDSATAAVNLAPGEWISLPTGYANWPLVGMTGTASADSFTGMMTSTACGEFALTKER